MRKEYLEALYRRDERIDDLEKKLARLEEYLDIEYCKESPDSWLYPRYTKKERIKQCTATSAEQK